MTVLDISYAQGSVDWEEIMATPGLEGVWIRASHGITVDTHFVTNASGAHTFRKPGQFIGYYHFAEYKTAEKFFQPAVDSGGWLHPDRVCVDVEGAIPGDVIEWLHARLPASDQLTTGLTWLYSYEAEAHRLVGAFPTRFWWIARTADGEGNPGHIPPSYTRYAMWQYSWVGHWPGIPGHVDQSKIGPGYPTGGVTPTPPPSGGAIVADKVLSDPSVHSSWVLRDSGEIDTLRGKAFYGSWLSLPAETRSKADVKEFVDFTLRDDGKPGYTIWVLTNSGAVHPYDLG